MNTAIAVFVVLVIALTLHECATPTTYQQGDEIRVTTGRYSSCVGTVQSLNQAIPVMVKVSLESRCQTGEDYMVTLHVGDIEKTGF